METAVPAIKIHAKSRIHVPPEFCADQEEYDRAYKRLRMQIYRATRSAELTDRERETAKLRYHAKKIISRLPPDAPKPSLQEIIRAIKEGRIKLDKN